MHFKVTRKIIWVGHSCSKGLFCPELLDVAKSQLSKSVSIDIRARPWEADPPSPLPLTPTDERRPRERSLSISMGRAQGRLSDDMDSPFQHQIRKDLTGELH
ncbi:hypothetical protein CEXT_197231 [Caerostris extrusa]|uniref:Uncharacterized protein n=1 Tax=Caerostris extrusa TaxID=172846 RepID=A0AAV4MFI3_CAEEX|nr:hypothetical protein CEXT_197231 [Caerostris extrusa]